MSKFVGTPFKFERHGASGQWISELYPNLSMHADRLCFVKSMTTDVPNHSQAVLQMHTGSFRFPRPSVGAWMTYGLGSDAEDLPGYLVLTSSQPGWRSAELWQRIFTVDVSGDSDRGRGTADRFGPVGALSNPRWDEPEQRRQLGLLNDLDGVRPYARGCDAELNEVIRSYELAFQMQHALPRLMDIDRETLRHSQPVRRGH